ncbi:MAG TPA: tetratricopeptide repeat protein [Anaerolineae bacterium]|nr:tetratricopeptide repeat protein [Anaerolineae bacterium]
MDYKNWDDISVEQMRTYCLEALRMMRDRPVVVLAELGLAGSPVVAGLDWSYDGEPRQSSFAHPALRGFLVKTFICWGVEQLKPFGQMMTAESWTQTDWLYYLILHYRYCEPLGETDTDSCGELANRMFMGVRMVRHYSKMAVEQLAIVLHHLHRDGRGIDVVKRWVTEQRYQNWVEQAGIEQQELLHCLSLCRQPMMVTRWPQLLMGLPNIDVDKLLLLAAHLDRNHMLRYDVDKQMIELPKALSTYLQPHIDRKNMEIWTEHLSQRYYERGDYLAAAGLAFRRHVSAGYERSAQLLLAYQDRFVTFEEQNQLLMLLKQFTVDMVPTYWHRLQLLAGKTMATIGNFTDSLPFYNEAILVSEPLVKAKAFYWRARAIQEIRPAEARHDYQSCMDILKEVDSEQLLLLQAYSSRAVGFMTVEENLPWVEEDLWAASQHSLSEATEAYFFYNALASFYIRVHGQQKKEDGFVPKLLPTATNYFNLALEKRLYAWQLVKQTSNLEWQLLIVGNLGNDFVDLGQYEIALTYYQERLLVAERLGDWDKIGITYQMIGATYFYLEDYAESVHYYEKARTYLTKAGNQEKWAIATICLMEVYVELAEWTVAKGYFEEAHACSTAIKSEWALSHLDWWVKNYPGLDKPLNERQLGILAYVRQYGKIDKGAYMRLYQYELSDMTWHRDVKGLCDYGFLRAEGKGRATQYMI